MSKRLLSVLLVVQAGVSGFTSPMTKYLLSVLPTAACMPTASVAITAAASVYAACTTP